MAADAFELENTLRFLKENPSPELRNPPSCKKRASVALILRIRPSTISSPEAATAVEDKDALSHFFSQGWVRRGDPEILFIRRATRRGDRWTGHVAFPGGKRDSGDESDQAAAERETLEEVGLNLSAYAGSHSCYVGNLPQQIVSTNWGNVPLLVLCPFVYLLTSPTSPALHLQSAEVASAHWVSLRALLNPSLRMFEPCDISERLTLPGGWFKRYALRALVGKMLYPAVHLVPSESLFCSFAQGFLPDADVAALSPLYRCFSFLAPPTASAERPLHLWGLTFGIVTDFLQLLPVYEHSELWSWPTFSQWDIQFVLWLSAWKFRRRAVKKAHRKTESSFNVIEDGFANVTEADSRTKLSVEHVNGSDALLRQGAGGILEGYFDQIRSAIYMALGLRVGFVAFLAILFLRWFGEQPIPY